MRRLVLLALALLLAAPADAQLGSLRDRARQAAGDLTDRTRSAEALPQATLEEGTSVASGSPAPGVDWHSLLRVAFSPTRGTFFLNEDLLAVFPSEGQYALALLDVAGAEVARAPLDAQPAVGADDRPLPAFAPLRSAGAFQYTPTPGPHQFAVTLDGRVVGALPVTLSQTTSGDPFDSATTWDLDGPWRTMGVVRVTAHPDDRVEVCYWIDPDEVSESGARVASVVYRDGQRISAAEDRPGSPIYASFAPWGDRADDIKIGEGIHVQSMTRKEMADGAYRVEVAEVGGAVLRTFRFRVEGGQFVPHERSAIEYAPRASFLSPRALEKVRGSERYVLVDQAWLISE